MHTLIVWASPNEDGLTAAAKNKVIEGINSTGGKVKEIHLNKYKINSCLACEDGWGLCRSEGRCIIEDDDFAEIYKNFVSAEKIVIITPVYWHDITENLKCLLDRMRRSETKHNHFLKGKKCLIIACAGGSGRGAIRCLYNLEYILNHMEIEVVDRLPVIQFNREYMLPAVKEAGKAFFNA